MTLKICGHCNQRYSYSPVNTDFVHQCNSGQPVLDQEDVVVIGTWSDYTGSGTESSSILMANGAENLFNGTRPGIEGEHYPDLTVRGNNKNTHRQRKHLEYIDNGGGR